MTRPVLYMAHPVSGDVDRNTKSALNWLSWLRRSFPETTFIAPWIVGLMSGEDDDDPAQREAGLVDCCAVVGRCDGIVLVGGRVSAGMARERDHGVDGGELQFAVYDLTNVRTSLITGTPTPAGVSFADWMAPMIHTRNLTAGKWCIVRTTDITMCLRPIEIDEPVTASPGVDVCPSCLQEAKHAKTQRRTREPDPAALLALQEECR